MASASAAAIDAAGLTVSRILGPEQGAAHLAAATSRLDPGGEIGEGFVGAGQGILLHGGPDGDGGGDACFAGLAQAIELNGYSG